METYDLSQLTAEAFHALKGEAVVIQFSQDLSLPSTVLATTESQGYSPLERGPFSVGFQTTNHHEVYQQGIYKVIQPDGKSMDIFLVPIAKDPLGTRYEAVFS